MQEENLQPEFRALVIGELRRISDKQDAMTSAMSLIDKRLELHAQKTDLELRRIVDLDNAQNALIDQHIEGVKTLKSIHDLAMKNVESRLERLEQPRKVGAFLLKIASGIVAVASAILALYKFLPEKFK